MTYYVIEVQSEPSLYWTGHPSIDYTADKQVAAQFQIRQVAKDMAAAIRRLPNRWPFAHAVEVQPERVKVDTHSLAYIRALKHVPDPFFADDDDLADAVAKLAKAYEEVAEQVAALQAENAKLKADCNIYKGARDTLLGEKSQIAATVPESIFNDSGDVLQSVTRLAAGWTRLREENTIIRAQLAAKLEPVADAEIRSTLRDMTEYAEVIHEHDRDAVLRWHTTLQAVGADLVVARESLEQCREALPEELRGVSVVLGISALIRSRTYAREQASQYARRYAEARDERDALNSRLSKKQAAIAKALEL